MFVGGRYADGKHTVLISLKDKYTLERNILINMFVEYYFLVLLHEKLCSMFSNNKRVAPVLIFHQMSMIYVYRKFNFAL